jgi:hypothetical protein
MKVAELTRVILKAIGVYWCFSAILYLKTSISYPFFILAGAPKASVWLEFFDRFSTAMVYAFGAWILLCKTNEAIGLLLFELADKEREVPNDSELLQQLAYQVVGIIFALPALGALVGTAGKYFIQVKGHNITLFNETFFSQEGSAIIGYAIQLVLGLALVFGWRLLVKLWHRGHPLSDSTDVVSGNDREKA